MEAHKTKQETTTIHTFNRNILPTERIFLRGPAANIALVARVKGNIDKEALETALSKAKTSRPLLCTRVQLDKEQNATFTTEETTEINVQVKSRNSENQWFQEILKQHQTPFNVEKGPLTRIVLLQSTEISEIIIFCHHLTCDGLSLAFLMNDILLHLGDLNRKPNVYVEAPLLVPDNFPVKVSTGRLAKFIMKRVNNSWKKHEVIFDYEDFKAIHSVFWEKYTYSLQTIDMSEEETAELLKHCQQNQVTVTSAICTAFHAARLDFLGNKNVEPNVYVPVNLRNRLKKPAGESFGLYASGVKFKFKYDPKKWYWDNVREFNRQLKRKVVDDAVFQSIVNMGLMAPTLLDAQSFSFLGKMVPTDSPRYQKLSTFSNNKKNPAVKLNKRITKSAAPLSVTNLGRLDFTLKYGRFELEKLFFVPSTGPFLELVLGIVTVGGRLTITVNYMEEVINTKTVNAIKMLVMNYLKTP